MNSLLILVGSIFFIILLCFILVIYLKKQDDKKNEEDVLNYLKRSPEQSSLYFAENGNPIISYQSEQKMPLASVLKIMVAIEFIKQTQLGKIDPTQRVSFEKLDRYYIPGSDGGAHMHWMEDIRNEQHDNEHSISLFKVAEGMMQYSSNANAEFLMEFLGLDAINNTLWLLCGQDHDSIFPISSAGLMGIYLMEKELLTLKEVKKEMVEMPIEQYKELTEEIHQKLMEDERKELVTRCNKRTGYNRKLQLIESRKMPSATTLIYGTLLTRLQDLDWFDQNAQNQFEHLMRRDVKPGSNFDKVLSKGGSSISILNNVLYFRDKQGNWFSLALFIHEPKEVDFIWLKKKTGLFVHRIITDSSFRSKVVKELRGN